jgi:DNA-binding MarR family transcriptional regulator
MAEKELAELLFLVGRRLRHGYLHRLVPLGLNPGQARALRALASAERPMRMVTIRSSLTPVVDALEEAGLVRREVDPANRRSTLLVLTSEGRQMSERARDARRQAGEELFVVLSQEQREQLGELLMLVDSQFG